MSWLEKWRGRRSRRSWRSRISRRRWRSRRRRRRWRSRISRRSWRSRRSREEFVVAVGDALWRYFGGSNGRKGIGIWCCVLFHWHGCRVFIHGLEIFILNLGNFISWHHQTIQNSNTNITQKYTDRQCTIRLIDWSEKSSPTYRICNNVV